jgi:peptidoglycan/LPS O-acetylase OafA/YrhL
MSDVAARFTVESTPRSIGQNDFCYVYIVLRTTTLREEITLTFSEYQRQSYVPAIDSLRAISVLLVLTVHVHTGNFKWLAGNQGVAIFFIISGYLITFLALREERHNNGFNLLAFWLRRAFRIFPMYYVTLAIYIVIILGLRVRPDKIDNFEAALPYLLTYLQEIPFFLGVNGEHDNIAFYHAWSLGIEEKFYLIWPALSFILLKYRRELRLPACMLLAAVSATAPLFLPIYGRLFFNYLYILLGCALAITLNNERMYERLKPIACRPLAALIFIALLTTHFLWPVFAAFPFDDFIDCLYGVVATIFVGSVLLAGNKSDRFLGLFLLPFLGRLSYSFYLLHVLCLNVVEFATGHLSELWSTFLPLLNLFCTFLLTCFVAWGFQITIERPMIRFGHYLSGRVLRANRITSG